MLDRDEIEHFLQEHWQKKACFLAGPLPAELPQLSPDELAWLAMQPDVESRLVYTDRNGDDVRYRVEFGPFNESILVDLPPRDWTLLVQDVEKHLPEFRWYLSQVAFVPDWRIDDLMVSCAAPGGSVGPHVDNYDVFLCQGSGVREWKTGDPNQVEADEKTEELSLVRPFPAAHSHRTEYGDVLYLPPGVPHWGVAVDLCTTYSIGCRAPTRRELALGQERILDKLAGDACNQDSLTFYTDADLSSKEAGAGRIDVQTIHRIREQGLLVSSLTDVEVGRIVGSVATDPKAWLAAGALGGDEFIDAAVMNSNIQVHGMANIAWMEYEDHTFVFVNGVDRAIDKEALALVKTLCTDRQLDLPAGALDRHRELMLWMSDEGLFDAAHIGESESLSP
ncbi:MAG: cupin domain-containing protein [Woeseiaceae bacterium]|nr:cupin domain-containing protein [Woeseiaceae bacterium]